MHSPGGSPNASLRIPGRCPQLLDDMATNATLDIRVRVGVPPSQIGLEYVARHVMRADSGLDILHDREVTQPVPELRYFIRIAVRQDRPEHRLGGSRGVGRHLERGTVAAARRLVD